MKLRTLFILAFTVSVNLMFAQGPVAVTFKTKQKATEGFKLEIIKTSPVQIDWGNGIPVTYSSSEPGIDGPVLEGPDEIEVKIYGNEIVAIKLIGKEMTSLTFTQGQCDGITDVECANNSLLSLDVSVLPALRSLDCSNNELTTINLSANTDLSALYAGENNLSGLDVRGNTLLTTLKIEKNTLLSELNTFIPENTLTYLAMNECNFSSFDFSKQSALETLWCGNSKTGEVTNGNNRFNVVDLSNSASLTTLVCPNSKIKAIRLHPSVVMKELQCNGNALDFAGMPRFVKAENNKNMSYGGQESFDISFNANNQIDLESNFHLTGPFPDDTATTVDSQISWQQYVFVPFPLPAGSWSWQPLETSGGLVDHGNGLYSFGAELITKKVRVVVTNTGYKDITLASKDIEIPGTVVGMSEDVQPENISVYPSIFSDVITITGAQGANVNIISMQGLTVYNAVIDAASTTLSLDYLPEGVYLLKITSKDSKSYIKKVVKK